MVENQEVIQGGARRLVCCCCGESTLGRQWFNRDSGYGLCSKCAMWIQSAPEGSGRHLTPEEFTNHYGRRGEHWGCA